MNHLLRELAPITEAGWRQIDDEAGGRLKAHLAARRLVDWSGPHGWEHSAVNLGRVAELDAGGAGDGHDTIVRRRRVLPLVEVRVPFTVSRVELDNAARGAADVDFAALDRAADGIARIENRTAFQGWSEACVVGMAEATAFSAASLGEHAETYPRVVAGAVDTLRRAGIEGPYALVIGPERHTHILETTEHGGYLLLDHLRRVLGGGSVVRATGAEDALVFSLRGGDFVLEVGQDLSVGYSYHDSETIGLYLEESFTFHVNEPDAVVALKY